MHRFRGHILRPQPTTTLVIPGFDCQLRIVQPPNCAIPAEVDLRSTLSVAQSLSTNIFGVSTSIQGSRLSVQSRVPMRYRQMRFALCMSRAERFWTPRAHSLTQYWMSARSFARNINFSHNGSVVLVLSRTQLRFLTWNSHLWSHTRRVYSSAVLQTSTDQQTVEQFSKRLNAKSPLGLDQ